jgi:glutamate/tyrosine decarboxylase-like PLP-dependent enzyme
MTFDSRQQATLERATELAPLLPRVARFRTCGCHRAAGRAATALLPPVARRWRQPARGFATYAALRELGRSGLADLIARCCRRAHAIVTRIGALENARAICVPQVNQGLVRFYDARPGATEEDHDKRTDQVMAAINATGEAFFTGTTWRGRRCMRVSVSSWRTTEEDVDRAVAAAERAL